MLVENQLIEVCWSAKTRSHYENLGYVFTKTNDRFFVPPEELPIGSNKSVKVKCDYCGKIFETSYAHYHRSTSAYHKIACKSCGGIKAAEKSMEDRQNKMIDQLDEVCKHFGYRLITTKDMLVNTKSRIEYICPEHGKQETSVTGLLQHKQCKECAKKIRGEKTQERWNKSLNERQNKIYNQCYKICLELGYALLTQKENIKSIDSYIEYNCPKHGVHSIKINNLLNGKKCPECRVDAAKENYSFSSEEVYEKVRTLGGELLNKEEYINQDVKNLKIICPSCHKNIFTTSLKHFKQHGGQSCPECSPKESVGERRIRQWLENNNIDFVQEKWFPDCRDKNPLPFDFYLPSKNTIIEFDGKQHFDETHFFNHDSKSSNFTSVTSYVKYHDSIKNEYCNSKNISLIRIPYTEINNIEKILHKKLIA